jgi:hypothetical protein
MIIMHDDITTLVYLIELPRYVSSISISKKQKRTYSIFIIIYKIQVNSRDCNNDS